MKIVLPEHMPVLNDTHMAALKKFGEVIAFPDFPANDDEIVRRIGNAEILVTKWEKISDNIMRRCPAVQYIVTLSVGINAIDVEAAARRGVKVINCPTHSALSVAEHAIGLMFAVSRNFYTSQKMLADGKWKPDLESFCGVELAGKRLGIIGGGLIGKRLASLADVLGMEAYYADIETPKHDVDVMIATSDYVSLNIPYSPETHHYIDERRLGLMKKTAYLINTSRGAIVDQEALIYVLKKGKIAGAALDVFEGEPLFGEISDEIRELASLPNVVATPHIGYNTKEANKRLAEELIANVKAIVTGSPINVKN